MRTEARKEKLNILLNDFRFRECMREAFKYHIQEPENLYYVAFLTNACRKFLSVNKEMDEEGFLTDLIIEDNKSQQGIPLYSSFIEDLPIEYTPAQKKYLEKLSNSTALSSYHNTLQHFATLMMKKEFTPGYIEVVLVIDSISPENRNKMLDKYIDEKLPLAYYAYVLRDDRVMKSLSKNERTVALVTKAKHYDRMDEGLLQRYDKSRELYRNAYYGLKNSEQFTVVTFGNENIGESMVASRMISLGNFYYPRANENFVKEYYRERGRQKRSKETMLEVFPEYYQWAMNNKVKAIIDLRMEQFLDRVFVNTFLTSYLVSLINPVNIVALPYYVVFFFVVKDYQYIILNKMDLQEETIEKTAFYMKFGKIKKSNVKRKVHRMLKK